LESLQEARPSYVKSEFAVDNPAFTSIKQIAALNKVIARRNVSLTDVTQDQKDEV